MKQLKTFTRFGRQFILSYYAGQYSFSPVIKIPGKPVTQYISYNLAKFILAS